MGILKQRAAASVRSRQPTDVGSGPFTRSPLWERTRYVRVCVRDKPALRVELIIRYLCLYFVPYASLTLQDRILASTPPKLMGLERTEVKSIRIRTT